MTLEEAHDDLHEPDRLAEIRVQLRLLYRDVDQAISELGPTCALSGRCCRFREYGHTLFLSAAEAVFLSDLAPRPRGNSMAASRARGKTDTGAARPERRTPSAAASTFATRFLRTMLRNSRRRS